MKIDFGKFSEGLVPTIIQDARTGKVLMLGYMNEEALRQTETDGKVTFFSRSRQTLWTKGETSGNFLLVEEILTDCDCDTILIKSKPVGVVCHTGADTCFAETNESENFLAELEEIIRRRKLEAPLNSYTAKLFSKGIKKISQKVGEESVEIVIAAQHNDNENLKSETADLLYHLLVLLAVRDIRLEDVLTVLRNRRH